MDWTKLDWNALARLRDGFLSGNAAHGPYWTALSDLANYDLTYGERIGWKWDAVLGELLTRGWAPPTGLPILDWGCGSGIAGRRVLRAFGASNFSTLHAWDHSPLACDFSIEAAQREFPELKAEHYAPGKPVGLLVLSHVLNELTPATRDELLAVANEADAVLWVEPGTHAVSRDLALLRDQLRERFDLIAPCTHANNCPLIDVENARHWCHFFAPAPSGIYADPNWVRFGQQAGVDLRSLPYSFLVLEKKNLRPNVAPLPTDASRIIGRPRVHKAHIDLLACDNTGLNDLKLFKRTDPALHKQLDRKPPLPLYHWQRESEKITSIKPLFP
ncbi:MAG: class I SAM-dependent methyltransferase [Verrucomicrobia bacterium]|nr:class I SAM-dependent methyltransferase [Verrucomicrobiota bacterium]